MCLHGTLKDRCKSHTWDWQWDTDVHGQYHELISHNQAMSYLFQSICSRKAQLRSATKHHVLRMRHGVHVPGIARARP